MDMFGKLSRFVSSIVKEKSKEEEEEREEISKLIDSLVAQLSSLENHPWISENTIWADQIVEKIQSCHSGLRFLRLCFWSTSMLEEDTDAEISHMLTMPVNYISQIHEIQSWIVDLPGRWGIQEIEDWILDLQARIQNCKQKFQQSKLELLLGRIVSRNFNNSLNNNSTVDFLADILQNLKDLSMFKTGDEMLLLNDQIATLESKVTVLLNFFNLTPVEWREFKETRAFDVVVHVFAQYVASLVFLYWVKAVDKDMATQLNVLLFNVLHKYRPCVPVFKAVYIRFLKEIKLRQLDSLLLGQIIQIFLDLLLENLVDILKDDFLHFQESLTFLISFLSNPRDEHEQDREWMRITAEIEVLLKKDLYLVKEKVDINGDFSEANACLSDLKRNVEQVKGKILQTYDRIQDPFSYDFPKINGLGFFDFLLQDLSFLKGKLKRDTKFIPFAKHLIIQIEEELMSLRLYLDDLFKLQKVDKELKDTWLNVVDLAYKTEYAINSSLVAGFSLCYKMACLMEVLYKLKAVNNDLKKIEGSMKHDGEILRCSSVAPNRVPEGPSASSFNDVIVGLEEEAAKIVENLIYGSKTLDIVAIVGMPGLGKTTMANKVYNASAVRNHFHVLAYCVVSQVYSTRRILFDILSGIKDNHDEIYETMEEDLADMLRRSLLGKRYLIIMDDIWDVESWVEIKRSLPNNQNGSRVIFTTRNRNVALLAKENCILHQLRFLSDEEGWELFRKKTFQAEVCPPDFLEVGKMIAKKCKGLPLTIVLIAGLLSGLLRTERSLRLWSKISEAVSTYVLTEDAMSVLELSYQHLPEHLKPCFLYFGAFVEDVKIRVNKLMLLWIAEGFVLNSKRENLENVAREYLNDLVGRNLVIANKRSSYGGIKSCRIHDLVHDFCQKKAQEENLFRYKVNSEASVSSSSTLRNPYRLCVHTGTDLDARNICPSIRSLLPSCKVRTYGHDPYDLSNLKLVQVINLEGFNDSAYSMRQMQSGVHLSFLSISCQYSRIKLGDFVSDRWSLETLILSEASFGQLPDAFWNMTRLRHVDVELCYLRPSEDKKRKLANPQPQMVNLESFSTLLVSSSKELEVVLHRLPSLRKLSVNCTDRKVSIQFPKLDCLSRLESLKVAEAGGTFIFSFKLLSSLKKLSLTRCSLNWVYLSVISKLPCLEVLKLLSYSFVGPKWEMEYTIFPKLKFLKLKDLHLVEWNACKEYFPSLEVLIVDGCNELKRIPPCFGEMQTLKRIEVHVFQKSVDASVVEIEETQKEFGNEELQVIIKRQI